MTSTIKLVLKSLILIIIFSLSSSKLVFSDHAHGLSQVISKDYALQDLSYDVIAAVLTTPAISVSLDAKEYEAQIQVEEVFRGRLKKGEYLKVRFKDLLPLSSDISEEIRVKASLVNPSELVVGDRVIICLIPGTPMVVNSSAIYRHNSVSQYQIKQQMAKESFMAKHSVVGWVCFITLLLVVFRKKIFRR